MSRTEEVVRGVARHVTEADAESFGQNATSGGGRQGVLAFRIEQVDEAGSIRGAVQARLLLPERGAVVVDGDEVEAQGSRRSDGVLEVAELVNLSTGARIRSTISRSRLVTFLFPFVFGGIGLLIGVIRGSSMNFPGGPPGFVVGGFAGFVVGCIMGAMLQMLSLVITGIVGTRKER